MILGAIYNTEQDGIPFTSLGTMNGIYFVAVICMFQYVAQSFNLIAIRSKNTGMLVWMRLTPLHDSVCFGKAGSVERIGMDADRIDFGFMGGFAGKCEVINKRIQRLGKADAVAVMYLRADTWMVENTGGVSIK